MRYCCVMSTPTSDTPADRVRERMRQWLEMADLTQDEFAASMSKTQEWLAAILKGKNDPRLRDLDLIADAMRTSASELVRATSDRYQLELTPTEVRILEKLRRKPDTLKGLLLLLDVGPGSAQERISVPNNGTVGTETPPKSLRLRDGK